MKKEKVKNRTHNKKVQKGIIENILLPRRVITQIAEEVVKRIGRRKKRGKPTLKIEAPTFLDTSAIVDIRVFDLIKLGVFRGNLVVLESILSELKNIADSKNSIKKERGRLALDRLDALKKEKGVRVVILEDTEVKKPVDQRIIDYAKKYKGRIITCDYSLSKKAKISGVGALDLYEMANILKTIAVPGETFFVKIVQRGKEKGQGVGYLPDGTMIVVERAEDYLGKTIKVEISRVIQTDAGRIFFGKTISASST